MGLFADSLKLTASKKATMQQAGVAGLTAAMAQSAADRERIESEAAQEREAAKFIQPPQQFIQPPQARQVLPQQPRTTPSFLLPVQGAVEQLVQTPANLAKSAELTAYGAASMLPRIAAGPQRDYRSLGLTPRAPQHEPSYKQPDKFALAVGGPRTAPQGERVQAAVDTGIEAQRKMVGTPDLSTTAARGLYGLGGLPVSVATYASPLGGVLGPLSSAGSAGRQAEQSGATMDQQFVNAAVAGATEAALLKLGISGEGAKTAKLAAGGRQATGATRAGLASVLKTGGSEGLESVIEAMTNNIAAQSTYAPDTQIADPKQLAEAALFGFVFGSIAGAPRIMAEARASKNRAVQRKEAAAYRAALAKEFGDDYGKWPGEVARQPQPDSSYATTPFTPPAQPDVEYAVSQVEQALMTDKALSELAPAEVAHIVQRAMPEIEVALRTEQQREFNEAYVEWDQTVNEFDERDSTPESREARRQAIEPELNRYTAAEEALNTPITADAIIQQLAYGTAPDVVFDIVGKNLPKKQVVPQPVVRSDVVNQQFVPQSRQRPTGPLPEPVVNPNLTARPLAQQPFSPQTVPQRTVPAAAETAQPGMAAQPESDINLQQFGLQQPGPMDGRGPEVVSKMSQNVAAGRVGNAAITEAYRDDPSTYRQLTHNQTIEAMERKLDAYDGTPDSLMRLYDDWADRVQDGRYDTADVALTRVLANEFTNKGMTYKGEQAYAIMIERQTEAGRLVDASKLLYDAAAKNPMVAKTVLDNLIKKINNEGSEKYGDKWTDFSLTKEEADAMQALKRPDGTFDDAGFEALRERVTQRIADNLPRNMWETLNSWRRFAMLTSPKTHIRNVLSNTVRSGMEQAKDVAAFGFEKILNVPKEQRTKVLNWKYDGATKNDARAQTVAKALDDHMAELRRKVKYEISNLKSVEMRKNAFKPGSALDTASNAVMNALEKEDVWAMKPAFRNALGQMMKARGVDTPSPEMIQRAMDTAWDVTFKNLNTMSRFILEAKRHGTGGRGALSFLTEAMIPFVTTPAAIAKATVEFSPVGFVKAMTDMARDKSLTGADLSDKLARASTGTLALVFGILASQAGMSFGDDEKSKKAKAIQEMGGGRQKFSVKVPDAIGGGTVTMDWLQPLATVFFIGTQMGQKIKDGDADMTLDGVLDLAFLGADTFFNQSMLQGVKRTLGGQAGSVGEGIANLGVDYVEQFIPTLFTQTVKSFDPAQRIGYGEGFLESAGKGIQSRIAPRGFGGAIKPLEPYVTPFGEEKTLGGPAARTIQNIFSPGFYRPTTQDPVAKDLYDLYQRTQETDVLPKEPPSGLTPEQQTAFRKAHGAAARSAAQAEFAKPDYDSLTPEEQVKRLRRAMQKVYDEQKKKLAK